jgi:hypothetical protein
LNWYGFNCRTEDGGACGTVPYRIASFNIHERGEAREDQGKCWNFAELGAGTRGFGGEKAMVAGVVGAFLAIWLAL